MDLVCSGTSTIDILSAMRLHELRFKQFIVESNAMPSQERLKLGCHAGQCVHPHKTGCTSEAHASLYVESRPIK